MEDDTGLTLDSILMQLGQFGKFQLINYLWISIPMAFNAIFTLTYIFTAGTVVHRCSINECDTSMSSYNAPWVDFTIPKDGNSISQCEQYSPIYDSNETSIDICKAEYFSDSDTQKCKNYIFRDEEVTISNDYGIYCSDDWQLTLVGTINNVGQFVGIPIGGLLSDRYGRRTVLAVGGALSAVMGLIRSFSPNYYMFVTFEFLDAVVGSSLYTSVFILGIELVGPKKRVIACSVITIFYAIGEILLGLLAKYINSWQVLLRVLYIPAFIHIGYFWFIPESVRWLMGQQEDEKVTKTLTKMAKVNKKDLPETSIKTLLQINKKKMEESKTGKFPIRKSFIIFFWRIVNCSFCWFTHCLVYYGLSLNSLLLGGDKYNNFMLSALVEIPGFLLPVVTMDRFGRRYNLCGYLVFCGLCIAGTFFLNEDQSGIALALFLFGKLAITASFQVIYFFTSEVFPTNVRNSLLSFCSMFGRFGSMLAPQTPLLAKYFKSGPMIIFSTCALLSGVLSLLFPETTDTVLPSTMKEAELIGKKPTETTKKV